jgi:hypothetical protein
VPRISSYVKRDGTVVKEYSRTAPGARRELMRLGVFVMVVWAVGSGSVTVKPDDSGPVTRKERVVYPIVQPSNGGR